jgi:hypothetical protein
MPDKWPLANGSWSNAANWNGGTKPVAGDDVFADGKTLNVDESFTVLTLRTTQRSGGTIGGTFNFNTAGVTGNVTSSTPLFPGAANMVQVTSTTGNVTINLSGSITAGSTAPLILHSGNCNLFITGTNFTAGGSGQVCINKTSTSNITITGNLIGGGGQNVNAATCLVSAGGDTTIIGNVTGGSASNFNGNSFGINQPLGRIFITGIVTGGSNLSNNHAISFNGTYLEINGSVVGGANSPAILTSAAITLIINGNVSAVNSVQAFSITTAITLTITGNLVASSIVPAVTVTSISATVVINGNLTNNNGVMAINSPRLFLGNSGAQYWDFTTSNLLVNRRLYTADTLPGVPSISNVRQSTVYGASNELTGTLIVPNPANVRRGVGTDNTVGTADLTAADLWNHLLSAITTDGSIGKLIKDLLDAAISTRLATAGYTAPDNTGITSIKSKTDNLPADPASNTQVQSVANDVWDKEIETGYTAEDILKVSAAVLGGKVSGAGTGVEKFRSISDDRDTVVATVDSNGNRTSITIS